MSAFFRTVLPAVLVFGLFSGCSSPTLPATSDTSPLPDCPDSPNCEHVSQAYTVAPDTLFSKAKAAAESIGPASLEVTGERRLTAVYRAGLVFKDDLELAVTAASSSDTSRTQAASLLHVRSASRVGYDDLGVNARRVRSLLDAIDAPIKDE